ncbi:hypothetical protein G6F70_006650 [Rhizopus microsporus]|uniref:FYVE-type domain-containing protein n=1 Tax=Rhizopus azygosporus TaxID=86630 RepID=A0A367JL08_RHIAZ|nr:hypothetical protein G6F71_006553 [Rhizopus microsporus]RCH90618.1 hypothetical protein CU097_003320 [Rhizopus azygosporus]KAG1197403.1 hypothetical protein G6F70_006650 [Rhizopus microsporus]KAG1209207.1 hypothetical protein G6F69_006555 [Rhizopus microsporus]KAG1230608.1 hypothetical protein G6F67_006343 [Rhizopus microsporus]
MNSLHDVDNKFGLYKETYMEPAFRERKRQSSFQMAEQAMSEEMANESLLMKHALKSQLKRRRESISTTRRRPASIEPRQTKSSILQRTETKDEHWDPHIDAFDILRAKLNGITRSMQELHVQELFYDELSIKRKKERIAPHLRRLSLVDSHESRTSAGHRRIRSHGYLEVSASDREEQEISWDNFNASFDANDTTDEEETRTIASPNLTALFVTTNNLIHSRLDELSETASVQSEHEDTSVLEWRKQFLSLVTLCIHQSEELEKLSVEVLHAEQRVRELMFLNQSIHEQFYEREKQYEERIRECQEVAKQQLLMIDSLEELTADIDMKIESTQRRRGMHREDALRKLEGIHDDDALDAEGYHIEEEDDEEVHRWDFSKSIADILQLEEKQDIVQKMRWDIGMFVGGGVGTGHVIHTFEDHLNGIDLMIAGRGTTSEPVYEVSQDEQSNVISPNIRHIRFHQHQYVLHITDKDKQTRFTLLPKSLWVPDQEASTCQFQSCSARFSLFVRRHHCRRCGHVICQRHSSNRLPLFSSNGQFEWSRVCDGCFQDLIIVQQK